jgi:glutamate N-acetyltransferase/amino-acid N-acetyltransferase
VTLTPILEGVCGVCAARGFRAAGVAAGIKPAGGLDLALVVSDHPSTAAGVFTTNRVAAAPVIVSMARVAGGTARGVVINSGCANASTGEQGLKDADAMADAAAHAAGIPTSEMLVCSTGHIGSNLRMDAVHSGVVAATAALGRDDEVPARAIMTTDTRPKRAAVAHAAGWHLGGMAKGAGMIAPNMATMLAVVTTDALVAPYDLRRALVEAVESTFNRITVDGDQSTNDTVLVFANGRSGVAPGEQDLGAAIHAVCRSLAEQIVADGEGATKLIRVRVRGAVSAAEAQVAARTVADSLLVKTALWGGDANWGRVAAALGRAGVDGDFESLTIALGGVVVLNRGVAAGRDVVQQARRGLQEHDIAVECDLGVGSGAAEILTTDLSPEYVQLNADYEGDP